MLFYINCVSVKKNYFWKEILTKSFWFSIFHMSTSSIFLKNMVQVKDYRHICYKILLFAGRLWSEGAHTLCYQSHGNAKSVNRNFFQSIKLFSKNKNTLCKNLTCDGVNEQDAIMEGCLMSYFSSIFINIMSCKQIISSLPDIPAAFDQSLFQVFYRNHVRVEDTL